LPHKRIDAGLIVQNADLTPCADAGNSEGKQAARRDGAVATNRFSYYLDQNPIPEMLFYTPSVSA